MCACAKIEEIYKILKICELSLHLAQNYRQTNLIPADKQQNPISTGLWVVQKPIKFKKMKKLFLLLAFATIFMAQANAQKYGTRKGTITFHSDAKLEQIDAVNNTVRAVIDAKTKKLQFAVLIKGFQFKKALMQEHFNENYMESSKYPKATFKGEIVEGDVNFTQIGTYDVKVKGKLTIHGVTKEVTVPATISMSKAGAHAVATFDVVLEDYGIKIPSLVKNKIAKQVTITVDSTLPMLPKR